MSALKSAQSFTLGKDWHLQWRRGALDTAAIEGPRGNVSLTDGRPQVLCAAGCTRAGKAMAFLSYMRIV